MEDWEWFEWIVKDENFRERLVLALDAKDGVVATRGWTADSGRLAVEVAREVSDWPLGAIFVYGCGEGWDDDGAEFRGDGEAGGGGAGAGDRERGGGEYRAYPTAHLAAGVGVIVGRSLYEERWISPRRLRWGGRRTED